MSNYRPQRSKKRSRNFIEENSNISTLRGRKKNELEKLDDLDSFKYLYEKKKFNDLDNQIERLKLELKSLVEDTSTGSEIASVDERKAVSGTFDLNSTRSFIEESEETLNVSSLTPNDKAELQTSQTKGIGISSDNGLSYEVTKHHSWYSPTNFSKWLDSTIDLIDSETKCLGTNKFESVCASNMKILNSLSKTSATSLNYLNSKFESNKPSLNPEKLLYESFLMQNLDKYLSSSDESISDKIKPSFSGIKRHKSNVKRKLNHKTSFKKQKSLFSQKKGEKQKSLFSQKKGKKLRVAQNFSYSNVKIMEIADNSISRAGQALSYETLDLDLENLNWDETFDLDKEGDSCLPDLEILESDSDVICISPVETLAIGKESQSKEKGESIEVERKKSWECPICFEPSDGQEIVTTLCGHIYCKKCLETYYSTSSENCPSCRTDLRGQPLVTLFNL